MLKLFLFKKSYKKMTHSPFFAIITHTFFTQECTQTKLSHFPFYLLSDIKHCISPVLLCSKKISFQPEITKIFHSQQTSRRGIPPAHYRAGITFVSELLKQIRSKDIEFMYYEDYHSKTSESATTMKMKTNITELGQGLRPLQTA